MGDASPAVGDNAVWGSTTTVNGRQPHAHVHESQVAQVQGRAAMCQVPAHGHGAW